MHVPDRWTRALSVFVLSIVLAAAVACSSSGITAGPTATQTTPTVTAQPTATPEPMQVLREIPGLDEQVVGSDFEDQIARLPDNEITRSSTRVSDITGTRELLGIDRIPPGTIQEELEPLLLELIEADLGGLRPAIPAWPFDMRDYLSVINWYPSVSFDAWSIDQTANSGPRFGTFNGQSGPPPAYDVAFGQFDPNATAIALAACGCDQPVIQAHNGTEYYTWGEELIAQLHRRFDAPVYDHVGRGPRLLIREGEGFWTVRNSAMEDMIDVLNGEQASLADDADYIHAIRLLSSMGHIRDITFASGGFTLADFEKTGGNSGLQVAEVALKAPLLEKFNVVAEAIGFDGERVFTGLTISHSNPEIAARNADALIRRMQEVMRLTIGDEVWADILERVEVEISGSTVAARLYARVPEQHPFGIGLLFFGTLLVHE